MPRPHDLRRRHLKTLALFLATALPLGLFSQVASARPEIRQAFYEVYPGAVGTPVETVPSEPNHCGVCHWKFTGGGSRNPYGVEVQGALGGFPDTAEGLRDAVMSIESLDPDGDGFTTFVEMIDVINYGNTPTFPGLTPANVGSTSRVDVAEIQDYLVPLSGGDTTPPDVVVISPDGGEVLTANSGTTVEWIAGDASGVSGVNLWVSLGSGEPYEPVAFGLPNTGSHTWFPANRPTTDALFLVEAIDNAFNVGQDESDAVFTIQSPPGGIAPTTLRDFDQPGTQPFESGILNPPEACAVCHGGYDAAVEPYFNWRGSMMAQASRDLIFLANMTIANQDAPDSGDMCLRCHLGRGWLQGRSVPTDGSQMLPTDESGVACDLCHRLVDPIPSPENPAEDTAILAALSNPPSTFGNGMYVIDPTGGRRGPFVDADSGHPVLVSPFHREAALCGTCHNVSNPAFEKDGSGNYVPNAFDQAASDFSPDNVLPVERTYSEWFNSAYNTPLGVYAPQFGGNQDYVATCQDCHMRDVTGQACNFGTPPIRTDLPLHDMTGGSTWLPGLLSTLYPGEVDEATLQAGIARARYMLQNAATLAILQNGSTLEVTITNETGHKLPTGYPEGRRMWINVQFYDQAMSLISESGAYDPNTGVLAHDTEVKIYETKPGLDSVTAPLVGVPEGPSFHFVLNNKIFKDNRIPPRGFTNAAFDTFGGAPVGISYADGQHWDVTTYAIPAWADSVDVTLLYQSTSKEFIEFLRDENTTDTKGQEIYDLWNDNGKSPPELMQTASLALDAPGGCSSDTECADSDVCTADTCDWLTGCLNDPIPGCADTDGDGMEDASDNCPTIANGPAEDNQADGDTDLVGDACDNCVNVSNPPASYPAGRTTTGGQLDDDADGFGNLCDGKFTGGSVVTALDTIQYKTAINKPVTATNCGSPVGSLTCDQFDLDGASPVITALDTIAYKAMLNLPVGPKCPACGVDLVALPCVGDACP